MAYTTSHEGDEESITSCTLPVHIRLSSYTHVQLHALRFNVSMAVYDLLSVQI